VGKVGIRRYRSHNRRIVIWSLNEGRGRRGIGLFRLCKKSIVPEKRGNVNAISTNKKPRPFIRQREIGKTVRGVRFLEGRVRITE